MDEIKVNGKTYVLKSMNYDLKREITALRLQLQNRNEEIINNKYKKKYEALYMKYRTLYVKYKSQSDRMAQNHQRYIEIIHKLQCEIINQASIDDLIKEVDRMAEIELTL